MQLPEICIKRPVLATVLSLIIVLIGLISYTRLSVREYPRIDEPALLSSIGRRAQEIGLVRMLPYGALTRGRHEPGYRWRAASGPSMGSCRDR